MALKTSIIWADAKVISASKGKRNLRDAGETFFNLIETIETEVREVVAVTYDAAKTEKDTNTQPAEGEGTYHYEMDEQNRVVGSYTIKRTHNKKTIEFESAPEE
jgi:hypothetical protein